MKYTILKKVALAGRFLDPGNEVDTDLMPVYTVEAMEALVADGKAEHVKAKAHKPQSKKEQGE